MLRAWKNVSLIAMVCAMSATGCKLSWPGSTLQSTPPAASVTTPAEMIHGQFVSVAQKQEILLALGGVTENNSDPLGTSIQTGIALQSGSADTYVDRCRAAGVPIPPPWGDPKWSIVNQLTSGRIFALDPSLTTTLYSYQDPAVKGTCAALPRLDDTRIVALGIICQSLSGQACFWDNKERAVSTDSEGVRFQQTVSDPARIRSELMANADNLIENCSGCHRGTNVFILHHEALQDLPNSESIDTYVPVSGQTTWANSTLDPDSIQQCGACHDDSNRLGKLDPTYCGTVMMPSIQSTRWELDAANKWQIVDLHNGAQPPMPPTGYDPADYAADIAYIKQQCNQAVKAAGEVWVWDTE